MIYDPEEFMLRIMEEAESGNEVYIVRSANTFPIENALQKLIFNVDYKLETPDSIADIISSNFQDRAIYVGSDGYSTVYRISNLREFSGEHNKSLALLKPSCPGSVTPEEKDL